jgi:hypothetical protein
MGSDITPQAWEASNFYPEINQFLAKAIKTPGRFVRPKTMSDHDLAFRLKPKEVSVKPQKGGPGLPGLPEKPDEPSDDPMDINEIEYDFENESQDWLNTFSPEEFDDDNSPVSLSKLRTYKKGKNPKGLIEHKDKDKDRYLHQPPRRLRDFQNLPLSITGPVKPRSAVPFPLPA